MYFTHNSTVVLSSLKKTASDRLDSNYSGKNLCQVNAGELFWFCLFVENLLSGESQETVQALTHLEELLEKEEKKTENILSAVNELFEYEGFLQVLAKAKEGVDKPSEI